MKRFFASATVGVSILLTAAAFAKEPIRIQIGGEPSTLDPARAIDQYSYSILRNVVEGLFKLDANGRLANGLVSTYKISKDGLEYRFKLRPDAKWSDGKPVTIGDCITGLRYALDPKTASPTADFLFAIKNGKEVFGGTKPLEELGVTQKGDELVITLHQPDPALLMELTLPSAGPIRKDVLAQNKGAWNHRFPVTGDYTIATYRPSEQIELEPNPHKKGPKGFHKISIRILPEETTAMNLLESGHLDVISTITPTEIPRLKKKDVVRFFPSTSVFYFSFNASKAPFSDVDWRKAIAASVDREGLAKLLNGSFEPITSYLPNTLGGHVPFTKLDFSKAKEKVRAAKSKPRIKLAYGASAFTKIVTEKIQQDLKNQLGLDIELEPMELKTLLGRLKSDPPEMYFLGMSAVFDDPGNHLNAFSSVVQPNFSRYRSAEYEKVLQAIKTTQNGEKRLAQIKRAQELLVAEDAVVVPMVQRLLVFGVSKKIKNFKVSPNQAISLSELEK